jgi:hypothetical protein
MPFFDPPSWTPDVGLQWFFADHGVQARFDHFDRFEVAKDALISAASGGGLPILGPVDIGMLGYRAGASGPIYSDHFVLVTDCDEAGITVHDPSGYPYAPLSWPRLEPVWRADTIAYDPGHFPMWTVESAPSSPIRFDSAWRRAVSSLSATVEAEAMPLLAERYRSAEVEALRGHLIWFALPLAARRWADASCALAGEPGRIESAQIAERIAAAFGRLGALTVAGSEFDAEGARLCRMIHGYFGEMVSALSS